MKDQRVTFTNHSLSLIIPAFNEADSLEQTLRPLQSLRKKGVEIILCDGGSTDATTTLAEPLVSQVWLSDKGRARQMNAGAMIASGDYLLFLHADTVLPDDFADLWAEVSSARLKWGFFAVRLSGRNLVFRLVETFMNWRSRLTGVCTGDQCLFVQKDLFARCGGYADISLMEDIELCKRLKGYCRPHCVRTPVTTSSRRWEEKGVFRTILLMWRLRLAWYFGVSHQRLAEHYYSEH